MLNILIADDEELERRAVKAIINSSFKDKFNIYEAKNGREAIEVAEKEKPDIIIMDIKMPGIDGIEAVKEIRKFLKEGYFIVLTAYDYFNYAKEIMEQDVKAYLLKPLKRLELIEKIEQGIEQVEKFKTNRKKELELKEKLNNLVPLVQNELSYAIINNNVQNIDYVNYMNFLYVKFKYGYSVVIRLKNKYKYRELCNEEKLELKNKVKDYIYDYITMLNIKCIAASLYTEDILLFIDVDENYDGYNLKLNIIESFRKLAENIKQKFNVSILAGIGRVYEHIENLNLSYNEALLVLGYSELDIRIRHYEDIFGDKIILKNNKNKVNDYFNNQNSIIENAINYINENYMRDLTLEKMAHYVSVSPYYFSKIFKKSVGKSYIDYLTEFRIEQAKEFLKKSDVSVKDVCYSVGYNDPNYFSRVFKKICGVSPTDFKKNIDRNNAV